MIDLWKAGRIGHVLVVSTLGLAHYKCKSICRHLNNPD